MSDFLVFVGVFEFEFENFSLTTGNCVRNDLVGDEGCPEVRLPLKDVQVE